MPEPTKIPRAFAASGDKNSIPDSSGSPGFASWQEGFPAITSEPFAQGGIAPKRADFNGIFNALSAATVWQQQGGVYAYDNVTDYEVGNLVEYSGNLYQCLTANGPNSAIKAPTDTTVWSEVANASTLSDYLTTASASSTYLTQSDAASTYLTQPDAASTYLALAGGSLSGTLSVVTDAAGNSALIVANPTATKGTAPAGTKYVSLGFYGDVYDVYTKRLGVVETLYKTDKSVSVTLGAYVADTPTSASTCAISVNTAADGTVWTAAPTPATNDNSTKIATTAFVQSNIADVEHVIQYSGNYYIRYSSGLQICLNYVYVSSSGSVVTYALPFTADPILLFSAAPGNSTTDTYIFISDARSPTGCTIYANRNGAHTDAACYYMAIGRWK